MVVIVLFLNLYRIICRLFITFYLQFFVHKVVNSYLFFFNTQNLNSNNKIYDYIISLSIKFSLFYSLFLFQKRSRSVSPRINNLTSILNHSPLSFNPKNHLITPLEQHEFHQIQTKFLPSINKLDAKSSESTIHPSIRSFPFPKIIVDSD